MMMTPRSHRLTCWTILRPSNVFRHVSVAVSPCVLKLSRKLPLTCSARFTVGTDLFLLGIQVHTLG